MPNNDDDDEQYSVITYKKLQPLFTDLLAFCRLLLPISERFRFATGCCHDEQIVVDMRTLVGPLYTVAYYYSSLSVN